MVDFIQTFKIYVNFFQKFFVKSLKIVLKYYLNPVLNIPSAKEKQHLYK